MITVDQLTIKNDTETLISNLSFHAQNGSFWAILGKNGCGKTTLLQTLAGFKIYEQGHISINNVELRSLNPRLRAQQIAFLPQNLEPSLNCTVEQSISYARYPWYQKSLNTDEDKKLVDSAIKTMELDHIRHKKIQSISGGELRKVEIATVLAQNSECFMLDEPLNHLDISFRFKLMKKIKQISKNKVIIMVTHDIQYVQEYCSHVIMLNNNEALVGPKDSVMTVKNLNNMLGTSVPQQFINLSV